MSARLTWVQPEDLLPHALESARRDGSDVREIAQQWERAGGVVLPSAAGAGPAGTAEQRRLARELLDAVDALPRDPELLERESDDLEAILPAGRTTVRKPSDDLAERVHAAWLGRAAGCLLGKPVEKIPREGIRAIAVSTGNWPIRGYFTARGLDPAVAARWPWNRRSAATSLAENIDGMPEDDDMNFPLIALRVLEAAGPEFSVRDVAQQWLADLPGGRVFTAERVAYRNLLDGFDPEEAAAIRNPFTDWIGAQIRGDAYGWVRAGDPVAAARLAWRDGWLSHRRNGLYGGMFAAAAAAAALTADSVPEVLVSALAVVPPQSRYAAAVRRGMAIAASEASDEEALDLLHDEFGELHWVHVLNNAALLAFAVARGDGDFVSTVRLAVAGGWDTDSVGATAGALVGALRGPSGLPRSWVEVLQGRLASSIPGEDGGRFEDLALRTLGLAQAAA